MRKYFLAAVAAAAVASPAVARDGQPYVGIEGGILFPKDQDGDIFVDFTSTQTPVTPLAPAGPLDFTQNNGVGVDYKRGFDLDFIAGYDFGFFRIEGEFGLKRAKLDEFEVNSGFITALNTALNRPSAAPDPGAPGAAALVNDNFNLDGKVRVRSIMLNALADFGNDDGLNFYVGGGIGRARVKTLGDRDSALAWQLIAGARYALSRNVDLGLKYRYFRAGKVNLASDAALLAGNRDRFVVNNALGAPVNVDRTTSAMLTTEFEQRFRSHSLLASLIFNIGGVDEPPPPPPVILPPPVEVAPPATQTCPDGSVILATDSCPPPPAPYVPPPPPPVEPERG